tara:strand:- start:384 stop:893 length:510 start_codon:yes stop_codon:yes gene_type:complete
MITEKSFNISRRDFALGMAATGLVLGLRARLFATNSQEKAADALLHLRSNGKVDVYSGGAHHGAYAGEDTYNNLKKILNFSAEKFVIITGDNPVHLPGFLGQNLHHMSFTDEKTNQKAATILKSALENNQTSNFKQPIYIIEEGISQKTREIIQTLAPEGIIVAVRQVV